MVVFFKHKADKLWRDSPGSIHGLIVGLIQSEVAITQVMIQTDADVHKSRSQSLTYLPVPGGWPQGTRALGTRLPPFLLSK